MLTNTRFENNAISVYNAVRTMLKNQVEEFLIQFPQYEGHFETGWTVGVFLKECKTKGGVRFDAGEAALVRTEPESGQTPGFITAWSNRGMCSVSVKFSSFILLK